MKSFEELICDFVVYANIETIDNGFIIKRNIDNDTIVDFSNIAVVESTQIFSMAKMYRYKTCLLEFGDIEILITQENKGEVI